MADAMILIDSSVLIRVLRDGDGFMARRFRGLIRRRDWALTRFVQLELLCGCRDDVEFEDLSDYLDNQSYVEVSASTWIEGARMFSQLKSAGITIRSKLDCCIAQVAMANDLPLYHVDNDFEQIARHFPLKQHRLHDR